MDKQIPIYFDSVIVSSPLERITESNKNLGRLKVRVFTKYGNRNGSYITDAVAEQLIKSATRGDTPVIGFFDPQSQTWASHTGPTLANGYGYVENFEGWQTFIDTDGIARDYAVFSVILFTKYFEEAQKVLGQNQSMELDINSITGDWANIDGNEYYVYKTAEMLGFCIIGDHEPCFSVSAFFSKNDDTYNTQYDKFSSLLSDLKAQVEEAQNVQKGGEQPMNEFENQEVAVEVVEDTPMVEEEVQVEEVEVNFEAEAEEIEVEIGSETEIETEVEEEIEVEAESEIEEATEEPSEYNLLQERFNALQTSYNELEQQLNDAQARINDFEQSQTALNAEIENLRSQNTQLQTSLEAYQAQQVEAENIRKNELVEKYENLLTEEEINPIKETVKDFSYDELESKLAITFANKKITGAEASKKVPLPEPEESQFALLMKKYRKN